MLNACQCNFSSKLTTTLLKEGSSFNDANGLQNAPKILEDVRKRLAVIEAAFLEEDAGSTDAVQ
jgi:hypothetical protein